MLATNSNPVARIFPHFEVTNNNKSLENGIIEFKSCIKFQVTKLRNIFFGDLKNKSHFLKKETPLSTVQQIAHVVFIIPNKSKCEENDLLHLRRAPSNKISIV